MPLRPFGLSARPLSWLLAGTLTWCLSGPAASLAAESAIPPNTAIILHNETVARPLPPLGIDLSSVTVSGLSSGAYMTVQMQTAFSHTIKGAAVFAGGPYGCARGTGTMATLSEAMMHCVNVEGALWNPSASYMGPPDVGARINDTKKLADEGKIDPTDGLTDDTVYLFSGTADHTVPQGVMKSLKAWYEGFIPPSQIRSDFAVDAGHAMITTDWKSPCADTELPFINDCDLDGAGQALSTLYGPLTANNGQGGTLYAITQRLYVPSSGPTYDGLHDLAHLFVPETCQPGQGGPACRLHVVFHGCEQNQDFIGDQYYMRTGYNAWAAANRIVVLYPQTKASQPSFFNPMGMPNPNGCWDWWGFTGQDYLTRSGVQMQAVWSMIEHLAENP